MLEIRGDRAFVEDPELRSYIDALGNRMIAASRGTTNDNRRDFEFFLLDDESINAFALLGGFIGIHSGLVLTSTTESELAGVVGHEIAHMLGASHGTSPVAKPQPTDTAVALRQAARTLQKAALPSAGDKCPTFAPPAIGAPAQDAYRPE